jgi:hypothetical protein
MEVVRGRNSLGIEIRGRFRFLPLITPIGFTLSTLNTGV